MAREIDERKKRKALRKLRRAAELAQAGLGPPLSDWEREFLDEVEARIETYGSAFADPSKGDLEAPLSALQDFKLREIDRKARGKPRHGLKTRKPPGKAAARSEPAHAPDDEEALPARPDPAPEPGFPRLRVIDGGRKD
jgi:hypothetical protein